MLIVAHRGLHERAPENSLAAVQGALESGCERVEVDVRTTADGHLVLLHDATLSRTTTGEGPLRALRAHELGTVRLRDGSSLPSLHEVLELCRGRAILCMDVKEPGIAGDAIERARSVGTDFEIWSSHREAVARAADRGHYPAWISHGLMPPEGVEALADEARQIGARAVSFFPADLLPSTVEACRAFALDVMSGTPNDRQTWEYLRRQRARAIVTDRPLEARAWLASAAAGLSASQR